MSSSPLDPVATSGEPESGEDCPSRVGEVLGGKYELLRKIGEGGMGEVYEARHQILGRRFAVKLLHPELVRSGRMLRRFSRESLSASRIESDHVVAIVDCGHLPDGAPFFVMDYLRGQDLRRVLREAGQLPVPRAVRLIIQVCHGLRAAHDLGLVHRDLKPENIFIQRKDAGGECAKILDFGVVQTSGGNSTAQTGALIGTLKYMAPEQARGDARLDQRADLYSLGAILYECLTGIPPHNGRNNEELLFHIMNEEPAPIRERRPELAAGVEKALLRSLHRSPDKRFQSAEELARALSPYAGSSPMSTPEMVDGRSAGGSIEETLGEGGALATTARPENTSRRTLAPTKKYMTWIAVTVLSAAALHALDRAWLLDAKPSASKDATAARIAAAPPPAAAPPELGRSSDTNANSDSAALPAVLPTTKPSSTRPTATRPPRKTSAYTSPSSTPSKPNAGLRADSYSANLDWKNPYDSAERAQR